MQDTVAAVDVGTGSARAAILTLDGTILAKASHAIAMHQPAPNHAEHVSTDIWHAVCQAVRTARETAQVPAGAVKAIAFDATCSLVVLDQSGAPLSVSIEADSPWDTIVWLDHRALDEAEECTATGHEVLASIGGVMSPEMQIPKLMWLKRHLPDRWPNIGYLFDLADFLTFKASGQTARSACTLTCKWTYLGHKTPGWQTSFLQQAGLDDLIARGSLPAQANPIGTDLGPLTEQAAADLGLSQTCRVATGLIDAHAGAIGLLGNIEAQDDALDQHIAIIAGTSTCHMAMSARPRAINGVWGPYWNAALPNAWLNEGGQSASGALLDHIVRWHGEGRTLGSNAHQKIIDTIEELGPAWQNNQARLQILPDFHGNRSPLADPRAVGVVSGLTMQSDWNSLCALYYRTAVGIALGTRHILTAMNEAGYDIKHLHITGGHTKNPILMRLYADMTQCEVITANEEDAVLLGTGIVAATATNAFAGLTQAARAMTQTGGVIRPDPSQKPAADRDFAILLTLQEQRRAIDAMLQS